VVENVDNMVGRGSYYIMTKRKRKLIETLLTELSYIENINKHFHTLFDQNVGIIYPESALQLKNWFDKEFQPLLKESIVKVYDNQFTVKELIECIKFYTSELGKKISPSNTVIVDELEKELEKIIPIIKNKQIEVFEKRHSLSQENPIPEVLSQIIMKQKPN